jgi:hypothetical protein
MDHPIKTTYLAGVVVVSNREYAAGTLQPPAWVKAGVNPRFEVLPSVRDETAVQLVRVLAKSFGLEVEACFFVREAEDKYRQRRAICCLVVTSLAPLGKKVMLLSRRISFPVTDAAECRGDILQAIGPLLRGQDN